MNDLFVLQNPNNIVGWIVSTNGILHKLTMEGYYRCNRAVGQQTPVLSINNPENYSNPKCKNCSRWKDESLWIN